MLSIRDLHVTVNNNEVLKGINLQVNPGEVHAIMGPNGSGKSTLASVLAGASSYEIIQGDILFCEQSLTTLTPEERALAGIFLGFQYPVEIPGVNNLYFLRTAYNSLRKQRGEKELDAFDFMTLVKEKTAKLGMDEKYLKRAVNSGFSGGEKKRNEILQMLLLEPKLVVLDEMDSGLDIDALQVISSAVNSLRDQARSFLLVTHYQRLLHHIKPDFVHVLANGRIIKSGTHELALELEQAGYQTLLSSQAMAEAAR